MVFFWIKNAGISKIKEVTELKSIFSETAYVCVLKYQISSLQRNSNEFQTGEDFTPKKTKQTPKKPTQIRVKLVPIDSALYFGLGNPILFLKYQGVVPRTAVTLKKLGSNFSEMSFATYSHKTGKCWNQTFLTNNLVGKIGYVEF